MRYDPSVTSNRRTFLGWIIGALGALYGALVGLPVLGALFAPVFQRRDAGRWINFGPIDALPLGEPRELTATLREKDGWYEREVQHVVWVVRTDAEHCTVFYPRCTHLGCAYRWDAGKREFACPCHGGRYDITGRVLGGPPPRSLDALSTKIEGRELLVHSA